MNKKDIFPSKYLSAGDLDDGDTVLTIRKVVTERMMDGGEKPIASFVERVLPSGEKTKDMIINVTKWNTIAKMYGDESDDWEGKKITITPGRTKYMGEIVPCIDVVPEKPKEAKAKKSKAEAPPVTVPEDDGDETDEEDEAPF